MSKVAVIIKHAFRDNDYRVDVYEIPKDLPISELYDYVMANMLGPFEIISISERLNLNCKMPQESAL